MDAIEQSPLPFSGARLPASDAELALVKRRTLCLRIAAPGVSLAVLLAGLHFERPLWVAAAVIGFGAIALIIGALAMCERRVMHYVGSVGVDARERRRYVLYEGIAAVPHGLAYAIAGALLIVLAALYLDGYGAPQIRHLLAARPSRLLLPVGAALLARGLAFLIGFGERSGTLQQRVAYALHDLPARAMGLILMFWGVLAFAIGTWEWVWPDAFVRAFESVVGAAWPYRSH